MASKSDVRDIMVPGDTLNKREPFILRKTTTGSGDEQYVTWQKQVATEINPNGEALAVAAEIIEAAEGLTDARLVTDEYASSYWSDFRTRTRVVGWIYEVTDEEIRLADAFAKLKDDSERQFAIAAARNRGINY